MQRADWRCLPTRDVLRATGIGLTNPTARGIVVRAGASLILRISAAE
jgi:hypothetical protein